MLRFLSLVAVAFAASGSLAPAAEKPNVLFIAIDDLNDWIGCLGGHPQAKTPNMDALAARGTNFRSAHCQAPLCNPSRTSVLTGLRPSTTGVYALSPFFRTSPAIADRETIFQHFHKNGYATFSGGKIFHGGYPPGKKDGDAEGVDHWLVKPKGMAKPGKKFVDTPANIALMDWGVFPEKDEDAFDYDVATWAVEQLKHPPKSPFFLAVGFQHPHVPCYAPQKWFDLYPEATLQMPKVKEDDRADLPRFADYLHWKLPEPRLKWLKEHNEWKPLVRAYLASISFVDSQVGRVLEALKASGLEQNTIVVLWSDHGWHLGEKGITGKNTLWERSTHVPLIFAGPGVRTGVNGQPVELLDMYPTLSEMCGLPKPNGLDGRSLAPQLKSANAPREWIAMTTHNRGNHGLRSDAWRYIRYADGSEELYDVLHDPNEWTNLAGDSKYDHVKKSFAKWLPTNEAAPVANSAGRILTFDNGIPVWEGKPIGPKDPFPED